VDVLTAQEDGAARLSDPELLDRATKAGRVLFSQDDDLLREATRRQIAGEASVGIVYAHQLNVTIGRCIEDLSLIAEAGESADLENGIEYLPLR
jgi:predicted nuclease of predicted toxin-antitoxin system